MVLEGYDVAQYFDELQNAFVDQKMAMQTAIVGGTKHLAVGSLESVVPKEGEMTQYIDELPIAFVERAAV